METDVGIKSKANGVFFILEGGFIRLHPAFLFLVGANISTVLLLFFLQLDVLKYSLFGLIVGVTLRYIKIPNNYIKFLGDFLISISLFLYGLHILQNGFKPIAFHPVAFDIYQQFSIQNFFGLALCFVTGTILSFVLTGSTAVIVLVTSLARITNILDFNSSLAILLGAYGGSYLSMISVYNQHSRKQRILNKAINSFNLIAAALFLFFLPYIANLTDFLVPGEPSQIIYGKKIISPHMTSHLAVGYLLINLILGSFAILFSGIIIKRLKKTEVEPPVKDLQNLVSLNKLPYTSKNKNYQYIKLAMSGALDELEPVLISISQNLFFENNPSKIPSKLKALQGYFQKILQYSVQLDQNGKNIIVNELKDLTFVSSSLNRMSGHLILLIDNQYHENSKIIQGDTNLNTQVNLLVDKVIKSFRNLKFIFDDPNSYDKSEIRISEITINRVEMTAKEAIFEGISSNKIPIKDGQNLIRTLEAYEELGNQIYRIGDYLIH